MTHFQSSSQEVAFCRSTGNLPPLVKATGAAAAGPSQSQPKRRSNKSSSDEFNSQLSEYHSHSTLHFYFRMLIFTTKRNQKGKLPIRETKASDNPGPTSSKFGFIIDKKRANASKSTFNHYLHSKLMGLKSKRIAAAARENRMIDQKILWVIFVWKTTIHISNFLPLRHFLALKATNNKPSEAEKKTLAAVEAIADHLLWLKNHKIEKAKAAQAAQEEEFRTRSEREAKQNYFFAWVARNSAVIDIFSICWSTIMDIIMFIINLYVGQAVNVDRRHKSHGAY
ncbi:hypothetical protein B0J14DRAFT_560002 [Halenospora varia]|nr:hypothetical protein B0J14DRAFT_560002 [Halenospora varia]